MKFLSNLCWLLFSFKGRVGAKGYFLSLALALPFAFYWISLSKHIGTNTPVENILFIALTAIMLWINFSILVKRFHDVGLNGWWSLLTLPANYFLKSGQLALVAIIGMMAQDKKSNKYGDPYSTLFPPSL